MSKNKPLPPFMHHIVTKFVKYIIRTFLDENPDTGQKKSFCNSALDSSLVTVQLWDVLYDVRRPLQCR